MAFFEGPYFGADDFSDSPLVVRSAEASNVWLPDVDHERLGDLLCQSRLTQHVLSQQGIEEPTQEQFQAAQEQALNMIKEQQE